MPILSDDIWQSLQKQLSDQAWQEEIVSRLPAETEAQARTLKAFVYKRAFSCACDLLRGLLYYVLFACSLRQLSCWGVLSQVADVSSRDWSKRLSQANDWLWWLVRTLLRMPRLDRWCSLPHPQQRIKLIDASMFAEPGTAENRWRLHLSYDLTHEQLHCVALTDRYGAENIAYADLQAGDVGVGDRGYTYRYAVAAALERKADYTGRFAPASFPLLDASGNALDVANWLHQQGEGIHEREAWFDWQSQRSHVRLIACALDPRAAEAERKRCREHARQHGRKVQEQTLYFAGWLLILSTLDASTWSSEQIICLYQARWQIELLFKRIKQLLQVHRLRSKAVDFNRATVACLLIAWILQEQDATALQILLDPLPLLTESPAILGLPKPRPPSQWSVNALCLQGLRQAVQGMWTPATIHEKALQLQRHLCPSPRKRVHQGRLIRDLLYCKALQDDQKGVIFSCSGT